MLLRPLRLFCFVLVCAPLALYALAPGKHTLPIKLVDGRNSNTQRTKVSPILANKILHELFPEDWHEATPELKGAVRGAFTKRNSHEIFAIGFKPDPLVGHVGEFGHWRCGVFVDGKPIVISEALGHIGKFAFRSLDLDRDGVDEILVRSDGMGQGHYQEFLHVVSAHGSEIRGLISFSLSASDQGTGELPYDEFASVIAYRGGPLGEAASYSVKYYSKKISEAVPTPNWVEQASPWWE